MRKLLRKLLVKIRRLNLRRHLFLCKHLGHHKAGHYDSFDGCSAHATCKYCGYKGMIDSQGNLF